jgi:predicted nucleic acid-binding protein
MATAVIDANVLIGLLDDQDKWHDTTIALRDELNKAKAKLVYFDCVINETVSVLARRTREQGRPEQLDALLNRLDRLIPVSNITWSSGEIKRLYPEILELVHSSAGRLNFHDALIGLLCREQSVSVLVSFDRDFDELDWLTRIEQGSQVAEVLCG